ncbi:outer membrane lipoprotein-sorting protein [Psychrobium sp. 1_MG-2023]|uniref:outer membrane lipoprotein-sorting protein n=1 Tax=Psychrobium sp. 1_MG-2023 TaxID=3062624 RepID=UPI000C328D28|nr:outer membrane lipoprotein-sorting protein [Psychrobium sp. 1_MG-2023]MDP2560201.1 outer membrane lipoprotein-sorting protein [Psychrobium sp. 1_MG-2023]PKF57012.1 outer membrane lipoprotein-sorting protein [Alteromonadales bacterium alter-6D02]
MPTFIKKILVITIPLALAIGIFGKVAAAQTLTVEQIIEKANHAAFYQGKDAKAQVRMKIVDAQSRNQTRLFSIIRQNVAQSQDQHFLIRFSKPNDVKGMMFRVAKHVSADDDRWLFLPALDLVKRIAASDKRTSFIGSHFFYEDISGRNIALDNFEIIDSTSTAYIIKASPKEPDLVEFDHYQITIAKDTFVPTMIEYTNKQHKLYRRIEALKIQYVDDIATVTSSKVSDLLTGGYTLMQFRRISYNNDIPNHVFSERSFKAPPTRWLK